MKLLPQPRYTLLQPSNYITRIAESTYKELYHVQRRRFVLGACTGPTFTVANDYAASRYAPHRPSPSAADARLWIIRGCDRPRYIRAIFSDCRHEERSRLVVGDVTDVRDWPISRIRRDCLVQTWLTAGRDSRARHLLTWNCQRIRAPLMHRYIRIRVLPLYLCRFFPFIFIYTFNIVHLLLWYKSLVDALLQFLNLTIIDNIINKIIIMW